MASFTDLTNNIFKNIATFAAASAIMFIVFEYKDTVDTTVEDVEEIKLDMVKVREMPEMVDKILLMIERLDDTIKRTGTEGSYQTYSGGVSGATTSDEIVRAFKQIYLVDKRWIGMRGATNELCHYAPERMGYPLTEEDRAEICYELQFHKMIDGN